MLFTRRLSSAAALCAALVALPSLASAQFTHTYYLAEGATLTSSQFEEEILVGNPHATSVDLRITFMKDDGTVLAPVTVTVAATSRLTINAATYVPNAAAAAKIEATEDVVVERSMYWRNRVGGHNAASVNAPALNWFFAEGATGYGANYQEYVLVANPNATPADVQVTFLTESGTVVPGPVFTLAANARQSVPVNVVAPSLNNSGFATIVQSTNGVTLLAERAMYWNNFSGGTDSTGTGDPDRTWLFAEGYTGSGFQTFVLIMNPSATDDANVTVTLYREGGAGTVTKTLTVAHQQRQTIWVNNDATFAAQGLGAEAFSIKVESSHDVVVERAMYWASNSDGHATAGVKQAELGWAFAEGLDGGIGSQRYETYYLFANATTSDATVEGTFYREDGTGIVRTFTVPAQSRMTLSASTFPELTNQRFAAFFRSTNSVPVVAERAVYWGTGRTAGHASTGTPWSAVATAPTGVPAHTVTGVSPGSGPVTAGTAVTITGTNFVNGVPTAVLFGGVYSTSFGVTSATSLLAVAPAHAAGAVDVSVVIGSNTATKAGAFTYTSGTLPPLPPPSCGAVICDDLRGSTVGQQIGGSYDGFGYVINSAAHGIKYNVATITRGYFEAEVTGIRMQGDDGNLKPKILAMYDGGWSSGDPYRSTAEKRDANKGNVIRYKHLCGSGAAGDYIETDGFTGWNPSEVYRFRLEWGTGFGRLIVSRSDGSIAFVIGGGCRPGPYVPANHVLTIGNPEGGGDHGSYVGLRVRNVRIGTM